MPPKKGSKSSKGRKSETKAPETIPIYGKIMTNQAILTHFDSPNPIREIIRKLEALQRHSGSAVEKSLLKMIFECCGIDQLCAKINWREPIESLS